jgi:hypothetical protein
MGGLRAILQSCLNTLSQGTEIGHALEFVVRELDAEMVLEPRQQVERLQAVDAECLEKIIVGSKLLARHLEVGGRETDYFVESLILSAHSRLD